MEERVRPTIRYTFKGHTFYSRKECKDIMGASRFAKALKKKEIDIEYLT